MSHNMTMKVILVMIICMSLISSGLCFKCYVGIGDVNSSSVKKEDGFTTCTSTLAIDGITSSISRDGLNTTEATGCKDLHDDDYDDDEIVRSRTCHCDSELCNNASDTGGFETGPSINCYVGIGNVGSPGINEEEDFKTCAVSTAVVGDMKIITRAGLPLMMNTSCIEEEGDEITDRICYCNTDLCNSEGSTIKCYVGEGNVDGQNIKKVEGYESCSVSTHLEGDVKVINRTGSAVNFSACMEEEGQNCTSCSDEIRDGTTIRICNCDTDLCNSAESTIKCYVGVGLVGSNSVDDIEGFETCSVSTETSNGQRVVTHAGLSVKMNTTCFESEVNDNKTRLCYCDEDLCNSTADRYRAIVVDIVKSFASWVESIFDDDDDNDERKKNSTEIKEQCNAAGYVAKNRTKWDKFLSYLWKGQYNESFSDYVH